MPSLALPPEPASPLPTRDAAPATTAAEAAAGIDLFHALFYHSDHQTRAGNTWLGVPIVKCPLDLWIYQEIVLAVRPDVVVETGTFRGGSALFFASLFDLLGNGRVYTVDVAEDPARPRHPRITYLLGSSTSTEVCARVRDAIAPQENVLVVLDSDHHSDHVLEELTAYHDLVKPGGYLIVEDTHVNGHPVRPGFGPGPMEAVREFLSRHRDFAPDRSREKFLLTFNPMGYLRRLPAGEPVELEGRSAAAPTNVPSTRLAAATAWLEGEMARRDQIIRGLHDEVAKRDATVAWLHREVGQRDATVDQLRRELASRQAMDSAPRASTDDGRGVV